MVQQSLFPKLSEMESDLQMAERGEISYLDAEGHVCWSNLSRRSDPSFSVHLEVRAQLVLTRSIGTEDETVETIPIERLVKVMTDSDFGPDNDELAGSKKEWVWGPHGELLRLES